jgi:hypothetical protein
MTGALQVRRLHVLLATAGKRDIMSEEGQRELDHAFDELERLAPDRVTRAIRWLRSPASRWVRIPLGVLFIAGGLLWFLPVVGIELLPIGLLLIAQDVPFLKKPVGRAILWLEHRWQALQRRRAAKKHSSNQGPGQART